MRSENIEMQTYKPLLTFTCHVPFEIPFLLLQMEYYQICNLDQKSLSFHDHVHIQWPQILLLYFRMPEDTWVHWCELPAVQLPLKRYPILISRSTVNGDLKITK